MNRYRLPQLDLLPTFEAASRTASFTRAADELSVTQSAVSKQVKQLEDQLGVTLFERRPRALALTAAGEQLRATVSGVLDQMQATVDRIQRAERSNEISVTMTTGFASMWFIPRLERFTNGHPDVDVRISATTALLDLVRERIDVAIRICAPHQVPPDGVRLFDAEVIAVCSPRLLKDASRPLAVPSDIAHHTLLRCDAPELRGSIVDWNTWLSSLGLGDVRPAATLTFNQLDQTVQAAVAGQGLALAQSRVVMDLLKSGALVAPFGRGVGGDRSFYIVRAPERNATRARTERIGAFVDWLIEEASADLGHWPAKNRRARDGAQTAKAGRRKR